MLTWPDKDPDEVLDYKLDWAPRLAGDTIATSNWEVPAGIIQDRDTSDATSSTIWLADGEIGHRYVLLNRITTAAGRVMDQSIAIRISRR